MQCGREHPGTLTHQTVAQNLFSLDLTAVVHVFYENLENDFLSTKLWDINRSVKIDGLEHWALKVQEHITIVHEAGTEPLNTN